MTVDMRKVSPKKTSRAAARSTMERDLRALFKSSTMDCAIDYLRRGRKFKPFPDADLIDKWKLALHASAHDIDDAQVALNRIDLESEIELRSLELPYNEVRDAFELFILKTTERMEQLRNDPDAFVAANEKLQAELDAFREKRDRPKN